MNDTVSMRTISLDGATRATEAALAHARELAVAIVVAVADCAGELKSFARMDDAPLLSVQIAQDKAWTAAAVHASTDEWWETIRQDPSLLQGIVKTRRLIIFGGGVPLIVAGVVVGGIGVSGGSPQQDRAIAEAGASVLR